MDIDPDTRMARYVAFEQQAAPLLEAALADLREVEALQQALLPDLKGGVRERTLVETVLRSARVQAAPGTS
jgi:hypothetical protein